MPNWCATDISINCNNKDKLNKLYSNLLDWTSKNFVDSDFGNNWLGNIVGFSGISDPLSEESPRCRGYITAINEPSEDQLYIQTETAWCPMVNMWIQVCDKYLGKDEYDIEYVAEEPGCGLYLTNDPALSGSYYVEPSCEEGVDPIIEYSEYELNKENLINYIQKALNTTETDFSKLEEQFNKLDVKPFYYSEWVYKDIYNLD